MWAIILLLYSLGWSDLCIPLSGGTIFFVFFMIVSSAFIGFIFKKKFKFVKLKKNPHKKPTITILLFIFYIVDLLYEQYIPLLNVMRGNSMYEQAFYGIPMLHFLVSGFSFIYCFYLAYLFACFKKGSLIIEYFVSMSLFVFLFQRQNIMIVLLGTILILLSSLNFKVLSIQKKLVCIIVITLLGLVLLYVFGLMGNVRYGIWDSKDSSMIISVGKINNNYPNFIPKPYAWSYVYAISPLANLQHNVSIGIDPSSTFYDFIWQFLPNFISKRLSYKSTIQSELIVSALNVCTAYSDAFRSSGFLGMYSVYLVQTAIVAIVVRCYQGNEKYKVCAYLSMIYFYLLSFFSNPMIYDITSLIVIYLLLVYVFKFIILNSLRLQTKKILLSVKGNSGR